LLDARLQSIANSMPAVSVLEDATRVETRSASALSTPAKGIDRPHSDHGKNTADWIWVAALASLLVSIAAGIWLLSERPRPMSPSPHPTQKPAEPQGPTAPGPPLPIPIPDRGWDKDWSFDKEHATGTHKNRGFVLFSRHGTYTFTIPLEKVHLLGKSKLEWGAGFIEGRNYRLFSIDRDDLEIYTVGGERKSLITKIRLPKLPRHQIRIQIRPGQIVTSINYDGKTWQKIEVWTYQPQSADVGEFGFKDEITVYNFTFSKGN
jgi:hypothetical protein